MILNSDKQLKKELSFDQYGRYAVIRDIINTNRNGEEKLKVLDVGGRGNLMRRFLPDDDIFYLDPYVDSKDENYIKGDGCAMPLKDESFDWVVSADVFEHIPQEKREMFLNENFRVAKLGVVLVAPFFSEDVIEVEKNANENYSLFSGGKDHPWLIEHIRNGLPKEEWLEKILTIEKKNFQKLNNNNIHIWQILTGIIFFVEIFSHLGKEEIKKAIAEFNYFYNTQIYPFDFFGPSYRKIYFIKKNNKLKDFIPLKTEKKYKVFSNTIKKSIDLLGKIEKEKRKFIDFSNIELKQKKEELNSLKEDIEKIKSDHKNKILHLQERIFKKDCEIDFKNEKIRKLRSSFLSIFINLIRRVRSLKPHHIANLIKLARKVKKEKGIKESVRCAYKYLIHGRDYFRYKSRIPGDYTVWIRRNEKLKRDLVRNRIANFDKYPKISLFVFQRKSELFWLKKTINSLTEQLYENWELFVIGIDMVEKNDNRINYREINKEEEEEIVFNDILKHEAGEYISFIQEGDEISPYALFENVKIINKFPRVKFLYSDEDELGEDNERINPFFKPDWSPELLLSQMYTGGLAIYDKKLIEENKRLISSFGRAAEYHLVLGLIGKMVPEKIFHIAKVLYHRRKFLISKKEQTIKFEEEKRAIQKYLEKNKIEGEVINGKHEGIFRVKRKIHDCKKVSMIIPFKDQGKFLEICVKSILDKTKYINYEIILVNNQSINPETKKIINSLCEDSKIRCIDYNRPFNYSAINNHATKYCDGDYILFLNNDTEIISKDWLEAMVEHIQRPEVGAVGAKLLYSSGSVQHAGVIIGIGVADHAFNGLPPGNSGYFYQVDVIRNYSAVTAACMLTKKKIFLEIGGFNEEDLPVSFNDVDYCLRLQEKGYYIIYTPYALLYHHESISRGSDDDKNLRKEQPKKYQRVMSERAYMRNKWEKYIKKDPFYNPNLTRVRKDFSIRIN